MRIGHSLTGVGVRPLSKELMRTRTRKSGGTPTSENREEKETVFVVGYESKNDPINPHRWSI